MADPLKKWIFNGGLNIGYNSGIEAELGCFEGREEELMNFVEYYTTYLEDI